MHQKKKKNKPTELKEEIDSSTITIGNFKYPTFNNGQNKQKVSKETEDLNNAIKQPDIIDINRTLHSTEYTFFPTAHATFSKTDHNFRTQNKSQQI